MKKYNVWVGGSEINDYHLDKEEAEKLEEEWKEKGYDDVKIVEVELKNGNISRKS